MWRTQSIVTTEFLRPCDQRAVTRDDAEQFIALQKEAVAQLVKHHEASAAWVAPTSRASSSSATGIIAIRSPSAITPLLCEALESTREDLAFTAFPQLFAERGLPSAIRSDNGVPFASPNALFNLSSSPSGGSGSASSIKPGKPQQNGRHERMHFTLKTETKRPPGSNSLLQQARFDVSARSSIPKDLTRLSP